LVTIKVFLKEGELWCTIEDNGVGFKVSLAQKNKEERKKHGSAGLSITKERLALMHKLNGSNYIFEMIDLSENQKNATGTQVMFSVPSLIKTID
jgi:nitrate/nitrite-specific signal transduction histidine kinase